MKSFLFNIGDSNHRHPGISLCVRIRADSALEAIGTLRKCVGEEIINVKALGSVPGLEYINLHLHPEAFRAATMIDSEEVEDGDAKKA